MIDWLTIAIAVLVGLACGWVLFADHGTIVGCATQSIVDDHYVESIPKPTDNMGDPPGSMRVAMP